MRTRPVTTTAAILGAILAAPAAADTLAWPGVAPCAATLQACIDGSDPGDVVELATATPVDEDLTIPHSLTLRSAAGVKAKLAPFSYILATVEAGEPAMSLVVEDLELQNGFIRVVHTGAAAADLQVRRVRIRQTSFNAAVSMENSGSGASSVRVENSDIDLAGLGFSDPSGINLALYGTGSVDASVRFNRIRAYSLGQNGVLESYNAGNGTLLLDALGNRIEGEVYNNGINVRGGGSTAWIVSNVIRGQVAEAGHPGAITASSSGGPLEVHILNNTVVDNERGISVSVRADLGGTATGTIANNIVAFTGRGGIGIDLEAGVAVHHNLLFGNGPSETFDPGPGTVTANPRLLTDRFRVAAGSPAIGAADAAALTAVLAARDLPAVDIDGLRRVKGGTLDIGAFESGWQHQLHTETSASTGTHTSIIEWPQVDGMPGAPVLFTQNWNPPGSGGVYNDAHMGIYYFGGFFRLFNEDFTDIPQGAAFNLVRTDADGAIGHLATPDTLSGFTTLLDDARVNGRSDAILQVVHHWNGHGSPGIYANLPIGVAPFGAAWLLINLADAPVPANSAFTVYTQDPSQSAYRHVMRSGEVFFNYGYLPHPLLDGAPCAQLQVTRGFPAPPEPIGVFYDAGRGQWAVFLQDTSATLPAGDEFHVLFDPAQVEACMRPVFRDGFED